MVRLPRGSPSLGRLLTPAPFVSSPSSSFCVFFSSSACFPSSLFSSFSLPISAGHLSCVLSPSATVVRLPLADLESKGGSVHGLAIPIATDEGAVVAAEKGTLLVGLRLPFSTSSSFTSCVLLLRLLLFTPADEVGPAFVDWCRTRKTEAS